MINKKTATTLKAYLNGKLCFENGHSIYYNPFRNDNEILMSNYWEQGWKDAKEESL